MTASEFAQFKALAARVTELEAAVAALQPKPSQTLTLPKKVA